MSDLTPEARLMRLASRQCSVFTKSQARNVGMSLSAIRSRLDRGLWRPMHRAVYIGAGIKVEWQQKVMAACLACGPDTIASFASAAIIWEFSSKLVEPDVTLLRNVHLERPGIDIHRAESVMWGRYRGFRVTTPMQTILNLAGELEPLELEEILDVAHGRRRVDLRRLKRHLAHPENRALPGSRALREMLSVRSPDEAIDSRLETKLFHALRKLGLPIPLPQFRVETRSGTKYIDFAYPEHMLAIEMDGFESRATPQALDYDRARQNELEELNFRFRRFTWNMVRTDVMDVCFTIARALDLVPSRWKSR